MQSEPGGFRCDCRKVTRPVWGEPRIRRLQAAAWQFQLTRPVWGEPDRARRHPRHQRDFNSLAPCGANPEDTEGLETSAEISTHSPRAGRTDCVADLIPCRVNFNSLAPCGANPAFRISAVARWAFQLTRPVRGEPVVAGRQRPRRQFQLTRPVRGEPIPRNGPRALRKISTHSPRAGRTKY